MKRLLAIVVAVLMVGGAVVLRDRIDSGGDGGGGGGGEGPTTAATVSCLAEVLDACRLATGGLARSVTAGSAVDQLLAEPVTEAAAAVDAWVLPRYVVDAVEAHRARIGAPTAFGAVSDAVGWTEVVPAGVPDRLAALAGACGGAVDWRCVAERAGTPWADVGAPFPGVVKVGLDPPRSSATGLVALGALAASVFSPLDPNASEVQVWVQDLGRSRLGATPSARGALSDLATRPGTYDVAAALAAPAAPIAAANAQRVAVTAPAPAAALDVVVVSGAGRGLDRDLVDGVAAQLEAAGWQSGSAPDGLVPEGDVLVALRSISGR